MLAFIGTATADEQQAQPEMTSSLDISDTYKISKDDDVSESVFSNLLGPVWQIITGGEFSDNLGAWVDIVGHCWTSGHLEHCRNALLQGCYHV